MSRTRIYVHVNIKLYIIKAYIHVSVVCQSKRACLHTQVNMVVFFTQKMKPKMDSTHGNVHSCPSLVNQ